MFCVTITLTTFSNFYFKCIYRRKKSFQKYSSYIFSKIWCKFQLQLVTLQNVFHFFCERKWSKYFRICKLKETDCHRTVNMTWGCIQSNHDLSFLFANSFEWHAKKHTRTKIVTWTLRGDEVGGLNLTHRTPVRNHMTSSFPTEQSVARVILGGLSSHKTTRQSKQIVSTKPHILKNKELHVNGMYFSSIRTFPVCFDGVSAAWVSHGFYSGEMESS